MKPISTKDLSPTLNLSECQDGWWLYDTTRGMNLAMRAETSEAAFVEALEYYQERLTETQSKLSALQGAVSRFAAGILAMDPDIIPDTAE